MKDLIISMSWLNKAVFMGLGSVMFPLLMTTLCQKGIKPEVLLAWYMVGAAVGIFVLSVFGGSGLVTDDYRDFFVHTKIIIFIVLLGGTFGVVMNTFYGQALQTRRWRFRSSTLQWCWSIF